MNIRFGKLLVTHFFLVVILLHFQNCSPNFSSDFKTLNTNSGQNNSQDSTLIFLQVPENNTTLTTATFSFKTTNLDSELYLLQCSLDNEAFSNCVSPVIKTGLTIGSHNFRIQTQSLTKGLASISNNWNVTATSYPSLNSKTYYFVDCGTGADPACLSNINNIGNDSNSGTSASSPFRTSAKFQQVFNSAQPGDQILFAQCGAWTSMQTNLHNIYSAANPNNLNAMIANPVIIDSYRPTWCTTGARPILQGTTGLGDSVMYFSAGSSGAKDGGFIIRHLLFQGAGYINNGAISFLRWPRHILIDDIVVNNFGGGAITCGGQPNYAYPEHIKIINSSFSNNGKLGIGFFGCSNVLIENNKFDNNGFDDGVLSSQPINQNHQLYISGTDANDGSITTGVVVRKNIFTNSSMKNGMCQSAVIVGHDLASDWVVEDNLISQATGTNAGGCWGISFSPANGGYTEGMERLTIRGNTLINVGNNGIQLAACKYCMVENNILIWTSADNGGVDAIRYHHAVTTPATTGTQLTIRNNSIYFNQSTDLSRGIVINDDGEKHIVVSNLIYFGTGTNIAATCFDTNLNSASFGVWNNNCCYNFTNWSTPNASLSSWKLATGFDINSVSTNPLLLGIPSQSTPSNIAVQSTSLVNNLAHATLSSMIDFSKYKRDSKPDIGAYENLKY